MAGHDGRRRSAFRSLNTEDGHWFIHGPAGARRPDALTGPAGLANLVATRAAEAPRRRDGATSPAPAGTGP